MLKQYIFLPRKMATGKAASQACHASLIALRNENVTRFQTWYTGGMCVIVLEVENTSRLRDVEKYCKDWEIIHHLYNDESEALKPTCLATGIIKEEDQWMFSKFKLHGAKNER